MPGAFCLPGVGRGWPQPGLGDEVAEEDDGGPLRVRLDWDS